MTGGEGVDLCPGCGAEMPIVGAKGLWVTSEEDRVGIGYELCPTCAEMVRRDPDSVEVARIKANTLQVIMGEIPDYSRGNGGGTQ